MLWLLLTRGSKDDDAGLNVCLHCFNGGCAGDRDHAWLHYKRSGHSLVLNIRRTPKKVQVWLFTLEESIGSSISYNETAR